MHEQLSLFREIAGKPIFSETPFFLFLNKKDLFEKMIEEVDLDKCFPHYTGGRNLETALEFIRKEFASQVPSGNQKRLKINFLTARYRDDVQSAWKELSESLVTNNMKDLERAKELQSQLAKDKQTNVEENNKNQPNNNQT